MSSLISVIMSTYNRGSILTEAIDSVLNQTYKNIEFIIINDGSTDNTKEILSKYSDDRIRLYTNNRNYGCTFNYYMAQNMSQGKYIAHIDDDDIWKSDKLAIQYEYMERHANIAMCGTFIETFGENARPSWVFYTEPKEIEFSMNFYNPICHSSVMYRNSFVKELHINYDLSKICAQDFDLYKQIILKGGLITNIPQVLVRYRMHKIRLTDIFETQQIQIDNAEKIKNELRLRYLDKTDNEIFKYLTEGFPYNDYNKQNVLNAVKLLDERIKEHNENYISAAVRIKTDIENGVFKF